MQFIFAIGGTVFSWAIMLGALYLTRNIPRTIFIPLYYLLNMCVFLFLTVALRRVGVTYTAWMLTVVVVGVLVVLQLFYWVFVNPAAAARYLTVIDWIIPTILVFGTVFVVARLVR
ncbi:MAG: hypothetical protein A3J54_02505 [Candidatus Ryanbacteria bacterium RIFCSPHIGHO2_02_FULL_45_13b]|uniref:Uncharacterized protein n=1 Tax=Candidatus Ryanbacteria bacterium RIFCSPHIGHO2_02_FULL_45_13b TaxID=1802117 RepID=A0A1G2G750_9BACT|nr:MAG: hypothetical protein A3J54_02505 [Candidatus Ryanbacteria bacterium RIFCSPHIGHO2_02_FULL_45_13b]